MNIDRTFNLRPDLGSPSQDASGVYSFFDLKPRSHRDLSKYPNPNPTPSANPNPRIGDFGKMTDFDFEKRDVVLCCCTFYQWIPNGHGQNDNFFSPLYLPPIDLYIFFGLTFHLFSKRYPALARLVLSGELCRCAVPLRFGEPFRTI